MTQISDEQITAYVEANIGTFHDKRLESLNKQRLQSLLERKNPYLFKSKNVTVAADLVRFLLDAHLSSQEETMFGDFLEGLAIYVAEIVHGGQKSAATGIDLEFSSNNVRYIVSIKSGPNWGNSSQVKEMKANFATATRIIRQGNRTANVISVNGCCYGRDRKPNKGEYFKYCGQEFWELISGDSEFYTRIVEPLGHNAKQRNQVFAEQYGAVINRLSQQFADEFCTPDGSIDWPKLVAVSSEKRISRSELVATVTETVYEVLKERDAPVHRNDLFHLLTERGFEFGGREPKVAVIRILREDSRFRFQRGKPSGWKLSENVNEADE
jgi:hypothetical protein